MKKAMLVLLVGILLAGCSSTPGAPITQVVAFGGDFSDNGNYLKLIKEAAPKGQYPPNEVRISEAVNWQGRLTNGPVAVEVLADRLKASLMDYAVDAATSGQDHLQPGDVFKNGGILGQVGKYETNLNGKQAEAGVLYYLEISAVDFVIKMMQDRAMSDLVVTNIADQEIANLTTAVTRLAKLGAKRFLIVSVDWSNWPGLVVGAPFFTNVPIDQGFIDRSNKYLSYKKSTLPGAMERLARQLNIKIDLFDFAAAEALIRSNPAQYGLTKLTEPCTQIPYEPATYSAEDVCAAPDQYYYWGYYYLTARVHQILGEVMAKQVSQ